MSDRLIKCPACEGWVIISSQSHISRCPSCGEKIEIKEPEQENTGSKTVAMKVKEASKNGSGGIDVFDILAIMFMVICFISGFKTPELFLVCGIVLFLRLTAGANKVSDRTVRKKVRKDNIIFDELTIHAPSKLNLSRNQKRADYFLHINGNVSLEVEQTEFFDLNSDAETEAWKTGKYFEEKYSRFTAVEGGKVPFRYGSYDDKSICFAAYYCTEETYYDFFARCQTDKYWLQTDIIDMIQTAEIKENPESLRSALNRAE